MAGAITIKALIISTAVPTLLWSLLANGGNAFQLPPPYHLAAATATSRHHAGRNADDVVDGGSDDTSRRECISSLLLITAAAIVESSSPRRALAAVPVRGGGIDAGAALDYNGVYTDLKHPRGYRILIGKNDGRTATVELRDDADSEVFKIPVRVELMTSPSDGGAGDTGGEVVKRFVFDFAPKGGPSDFVGVYSKDREGIPIITFPDGNTWKKRVTGPIGVYRDGSDPSVVYAIRQYKGSELTVDVIDIDGAGRTTATIAAKAGNPTIVFDFPGGSVPGVANLRDKTISFEDGNVWTKF